MWVNQHPTNRQNNKDTLKESSKGLPSIINYWKLYKDCRKLPGAYFKRLREVIIVIQAHLILVSREYFGSVARAGKYFEHFDSWWLTIYVVEQLSNLILMQVHRTCPYINAGLEKPAPRDAPSPYVKPQMMWRVQDDYAGRCSISRQSAKGSRQKIGVADCRLPTADFKKGLIENSSGVWKGGIQEQHSTFEGYG